MKKRKRLIAEIVIDEQTTITVDGNKMSAEFGALDRGSLTDVVDWGIYANRGSISFIDKEGYFNNTNVNQFRLKNAKVVFYLANDEKTKIATFIVDDASYDDETRKVEVQLVSEISKWQSLRKSGSIFPYYETDVFDLTSMVSQYFGKSITADGSAKKTNIYCPLIRPNQSLWDIGTKLCQSSMGRVVENEDGSAVITDSFPERTPIVVLPKNIVGIPNSSFVVVPNASLDVTNRERVKEVAKLDFTINWTGYNEDDGVAAENSVLSHTGAEMTFDSDYKNAKTAKGCVKTNEEIYELYSPGVELTKQTQKFPISGDGISSQNTIFIPSLLLVGTDLVATDDNYREICFSCVSLPIKETETNMGIRLSESVVTRGAFMVSYDTFSDSTEKITNAANNSDNVVEIQSNDFVQTKSYYAGEDISLGEHILQEVKRRYSHGIECFEIECLFNQYYNENNEVVFDGKDLSKHFRKYDIIIPYVVRNGVTEPLRVDENGDPKKFRIIGISYTDDGLLKQKLYVQEERYDID